MEEIPRKKKTCRLFSSFFLKRKKRKKKKSMSLIEIVKGHPSFSSIDEESGQLRALSECHQQQPAAASQLFDVGRFR
jgi:hypothetical protein